MIADRAYAAGIASVVWGILVPWTYGQGLLGRRPSSELRERLGLLMPDFSVSPARIVIHAVSVGEMHAASALVHALGEAWPGCSVVLSCMTQDARHAAERIRRQTSNVEACLYLPWDRARAVRRWLGHLQPLAVVMVETEIWPNLFSACRESGVPLFVVSGRIYPRDVPRYRLLRPFFRRVLDSVSWFGVQSEAEAVAFRRIGAAADRVTVAGNLKYDVPPADRPLPDDWERALRLVGSIILAGSTHRPEERWLVSMLPGLKTLRPGTRLVIAPRDVRRARHVCLLAERCGLRARLWSHGAPRTDDWNILVIDEMGWLATLYRYAAVVVAGGTFARHGGHNVLEACVRQKAVVAGPHVSHIRDDIEALADCGAVIWLRNGRQLRRQLEESLQLVIEDPGLRDRLGRAASVAVSNRTGAARTCADRLRRAVADGGTEVASRVFNEAAPRTVEGVGASSSCRRQPTPNPGPRRPPG